jgi:hypothetical protein
MDHSPAPLMVPPELFVCFLPMPIPLPVSPPRPIDPSFVPDLPVLVLVKDPVSGEPDCPGLISGPEPVVPLAPLAVPPLDVPAELPLPLPLPLPPAPPAPPACAKAGVAPIAIMSAVVRANFICFPITVFLGVFPYGTHNVTNRCPFLPLLSMTLAYPGLPTRRGCAPHGEVLSPATRPACL